MTTRFPQWAALVLLFGATALAEMPEKYSDIFTKLKEVRIETPCDTTVRKVFRLGDNTLGLESFVCMDADFDTFEKIVSDFGQYENWLLDRMNEKPGGGSYFVKFLDIHATPDPTLKLHYQIDIPLFKRDKIKTFRVRTQKAKGVFVLSGEGVEEPESLLQYARATLYAFPAPGTKHELWIYVEGKTQLKSSLFYQALPERVLRSEAGDRITKILENYQARESAVLTATPAKSSPSPK